MKSDLIIGLIGLVFVFIDFRSYVVTGDWFPLAMGMVMAVLTTCLLMRWMLYKTIGGLLKSIIDEINKLEAGGG